MNLHRLTIALASSAALVALPLAAAGQTTPGLAVVVATCGTPPSTYTAGQQRPVTQNTSGQSCDASTSTPSGTQDTNLTKVNGAAVNVGVGAASTGTQRVTTSTDSTIGTVTAVTAITNALPAGTNAIGNVGPAPRTIVALDVSTVTTGGTAVTALTAGHRTAGGFLYNPIGATINLCINEQATASGTTSAAGLTCIQPGQSYKLAPTSTAVSVITSDSSHPFSGYGLN